MPSETIDDHDMHDGLVQAARILRDLGRLDSATALLQTALSHRDDIDTLKALLESAERSHDMEAAHEAFGRLEAAGPERMGAGALAALRKNRLRFLGGDTRAGKPRVAGIMDEFTTASYMPECIYLPLHPDRACRQLAEFRPEFVFVESAWHGNDNLWNKMVSTVSEPLERMLARCRENGIPSVFWNKEDPVHFHGFLPAARLCDVVFTTDIDCIPAYKDALGHERVYFLPFAAQPQSHNPIATMARKDAFNFAGSYYLRYPERQRDIAAIIDTVSRFRPVEIYDRNHEKDHPHYKFPEKYRDMILGSLPFSEIDRAYKGYRYGINMNTIKQSQTMFARRVYELMASNTVTVSNFARGVRLLFGDLAICSDRRDQLAARLERLTADDTDYRKFRLAGLRKVMREHTYAARLAYIRAKIGGRPYRQDLPGAALIAHAPTVGAAGALIAQFRAQTHAGKRLYLLCPDSAPDGAGPDTPVFGDADSLIAAVMAARDGFAFFGGMHADDHYGPNYLTDLTLAARYSDAEGFGKGCHFALGPDGPALQRADLRYGPADALPLRAALLRRTHLTAERVRNMLQAPAEAAVSDLSLLALDEFNYCRDGAGDAAAAALTGDLDLPFQGVDTAALYETAEGLPAARPRMRPRRNDLPALRARQVSDGAIVSKSSPLIKRMEDGRLRVTREADTGQAGYLWMKRKLPRAALNLTDQSSLAFEMDHDLTQAGLVCEFYTADDRKISHSILPSGGRHALAIPNDCTQLRFGLRLVGTGTLSLGDITFGEDTALPPLIIGAADTLVLTKQYPSYDDLYKYGFLHSRVRGYRAAGRNVDIFRINPGIERTYDEFENVDVASGDAELLDATLRAGRHNHVLVHLLDRQMWQVLKPHLGNIRVTIWIHGAEIQHWRRREFEFSRMDDAEINRQKRLSDERMKLWDEVFSETTANLHHVFVSRHFMNEIIEDVGRGPCEGQYSIIHNHIDGDLFTYIPKAPEQRQKILSIRPYSSKKYANDLSVGAILELSRRDIFKDLEFHLAGSGELFAELTEPLRGFPNVTLHEGFLSHAEIAALHKEYGVFLTPTRMDSQGVSRDEAMASGLVPVTTRVAAVPEFVDEDSGLLTPPEDPVALADAIERLYTDPALFLRLSEGAAQRVRAQSGFAQTLAKEMALMMR